jgi:uncharacterized membrane protein
MNASPESPSDLFLRYSRQKLLALLIVALVVGAVGLALVVTPSGPAWRSVADVSLVVIALVILVLVQFAVRGRRWTPADPEVQAAMRDEWLAANVGRANRGALALVLLAQFPLAVPLGFMAELVPPQGPIVMAMATVMIGLVSRIGLFLWYDREAS